MQDFGCSVMSQLKEEDIDQLVDYLDRIYEIAEKKLTPENDRISVPASWYTGKKKGKNE